MEASNYFSFSKAIEQIAKNKNLFCYSFESPIRPLYSTLFITNSKLIEQGCCMRIIPKSNISTKIKLQFIIPTIGFLVFSKDEADEEYLYKLIDDLEKLSFEMIINRMAFPEILNINDNTSKKDREYYDFFKDQYSAFMFKAKFDYAIKNPNL